VSGAINVLAEPFNLMNVAQDESTFEDKLIGKSLCELSRDCEQGEVSDCIVMSTANLLDQVGQSECVAPERLGESWTH
jgi:hypothetical protein